MELLRLIGELALSNNVSRRRRDGWHDYLTRQHEHVGVILLEVNILALRTSCNHGIRLGSCLNIVRFVPRG
jgi:hypothetical protein